MPLERYYTKNSLKTGQKVVLIEGEFHHLVHVMRTAVGDSVELVNGAGQLAKATVCQLTRRDAHLEVQSIKSEDKPKREVILIQGIARPNRLDFVVEKGTELGMTQLWLFPSKLSEKKGLNPSHHDRIRGLAVAAMKQCGRLYIPHIEFVEKIESWKLPNDFQGYFGDVESSAPWFIEELQKGPADKSIIFVTGPESGLTEDEVSMLRSKGFIGVKLHQNILRTDTASMTALSIISQYIQ